MKHLKKINEYNSKLLDINESNKKILDDIIDDMKDILLPISDLGYENNVRKFKESVGNNIVARIVTYTDEPLFIDDDVLDDLKRLYEYTEEYEFLSEPIFLYVLLDNNKRFRIKNINGLNKLKSKLITNLLFSVNFEKIF